MYWRLNRIQYPVYNLGPGMRIGIWAQGCTLKCRDCLSPSLQGAEGGRTIQLKNLCHQIERVSGHYDGITISGGEPFEQYEALMFFCTFIKMQTDLSIYIFSGYRLEELLLHHSDRMFLTNTDFLLDGRYDVRRHEDKNARGSSNQRLYRISNEQAIEETECFSSNKMSVAVLDSGNVFMSGIPKKEDLNSIKNSLLKTGIQLEFQ